MAVSASSSLPFYGLLSCFSLQRGVYTPEQLCDRAREAGCSSLGIWDVNNIYGVPRFLAAASEAGLQPIVGARLELPDQPVLQAACLTRRGYSRLCELVTRVIAALDPSPNLDVMGKERLPECLFSADFSLIDELYRNGWDGLALVTADSTALRRLSQAMHTSASPGDSRLYAGLYWGKPHIHTRRIAGELDLPLLACSDGGSWVTEDDCTLLQGLYCIREHTSMVAVPPGTAAPDYRRIPEMREYVHAFHTVPDAVAAADELTAACEDPGLLRPGSIFPRFAALDSRQTEKLLLQLCIDGAQRRYGVSLGVQGSSADSAGVIIKAADDAPDTVAVCARLQHELAIITSKGFSAYFLIVHDIVTRCPRTCGRGSAAASIVSFLLGITHVDPLQHDLFFERFLNEGRIDPPDIDVDFPWDERIDTLRYVFERYYGHAAMVADHVTFGRRSAIRGAAAAYGFGAAQIREWAEQLEQQQSDGIPADVLGMARRLYGLPRHLGTHPGGVIITPRPIVEYTSLQLSQVGLPIIAWEKDGAEDCGLIKIDLLGNRSLAVLRDAIALARERQGFSETWESFNPVGDSAVEQFIQTGDTLGVFYVESPATRMLLQKMNRGDFEHVVAASSIIRPAANEWINEYVDRLHGKPWGFWPSVDDVLRDTCGIMVFQEDVSRIAACVAGFSPADADALRKVVSKKSRSQRLQCFQEKFATGCRERGVPQPVIDELWRMIGSFDGYSFCKSHSASYALVSFRLASLKLRYPLEFFAAVLNNGGGFYASQTYLHALRRAGFALLRPDVNKSREGYLIEGDALRLGLDRLQHIPRGFIQRLLSERAASGSFRSFDDFLRRIMPSHRELRQLVRSGACDSIADGMSRPQLFWYSIRRRRVSGQIELLDTPTFPPSIGDYRPEVKHADEMEILGVCVSRHPMIRLRPGLQRRVPAGRLVCATDVAGHAGMQITVAGILVTGKEVLTRHCQPMQFITLEDESGLMELVLFPAVYRNWIGRLFWGDVYLARCRAIKDRSVVTLQVIELYRG